MSRRGQLRKARLCRLAEGLQRRQVQPVVRRPAHSICQWAQRVGTAVGIRNVPARVSCDGVVDFLRDATLATLRFECVAECVKSSQRAYADACAVIAPPPTFRLELLALALVGQLDVVDAIGPLQVSDAQVAKLLASGSSEQRQPRLSVLAALIPNAFLLRKL